MSTLYVNARSTLNVFVKKEVVATGDIWRAYCEVKYAPAGAIEFAAQSTIFQIFSISPAYYHTVLCAALEYATRHNAIFEGIRDA